MTEKTHTLAHIRHFSILFALVVKKMLTLIIRTFFLLLSYSITISIQSGLDFSKWQIISNQDDTLLQYVPLLTATLNQLTVDDRWFTIDNITTAQTRGQPLFEYDVWYLWHNENHAEKPAWLPYSNATHFSLPESDRHKCHVMFYVNPWTIQFVIQSLQCSPLQNNDIDTTTAAVSR